MTTLERRAYNPFKGRTDGYRRHGYLPNDHMGYTDVIYFGFG